MKTPQQIAERIRDAIGLWDDGHQIKIRIVNDGDGYFNIMDISLTEDGLAEIARVLAEEMEQGNQL